ncbi:DUF7544 domain-containing protein [Salinilacihabitans rarus]|uniref:DUF7544 domain-containing protein n=1 Tax=Salinilacihabitans rarus TaxID=2961596 RepID=UPI0020C8FB40|nr:hypothetical protein [Salinilacihabitans rarus]
MYAVDDLGDAIDATREFLTPVRAGMWLRLALVVFFVGGASGGFPSVPGGTGTSPDTGPTDPGPAPGPEPTLTDGEILATILVIVGIVVAIALVFALIGSIMEFVFFESLRNGEVHLRRYSNRNVGKGLRLFGFRVVVGLLTAALVLGPFAALFLLGGFGDGTFVAALFLLIPVVILVALVSAVVGRFTTVFVAPIMLLEERGVLSAWRRFWPTFRGNWTEYVVYLLLVWVLRIAVGIGVGLVAAFVAVVAAIPFLVVGAALVFGLGDVGFLLAVPVGLLGLLVVLVLVLLVSVPIETYFRYYALLLLGDTNPDLDLVPEQRAAIRGDGGEDDGDRGWDAGPEDGGDTPGAGDEPAGRDDSRDRDDRSSTDDEDDWHW